MVSQEKSRRERVRELSELESTKEFLDLIKYKIKESDEDVDSVLTDILKKFQVMETNKIFVCESSYIYECTCGYECDDWSIKKFKSISNIEDYEKNLEVREPIYRAYRDIESTRLVVACNIPRNPYELMSDFESKNIILNPYDSPTNQNGYEEVRELFFKTSIEKGQAKSLQTIFKKYPRLQKKDN